MSTIEHRNPPSVLVHLYRASVAHADVWRMRLDATTNWAVITTAAVLTFAFGSPSAPHFTELMALPFVLFFLFMESRRYQAYHLWQRRIRVLHRALVVPALKEPADVDESLVHALFRRLADDLARWVPAMPLWAALGYRLRRNYGPLITLILLAWLLKLYIHPDVVVSLDAYVDRATVGLVPGRVVLAGVGIFFLLCVGLALAAPTEQMKDWSALPSPIERLPSILKGEEPQPTPGQPPAGGPLPEVDPPRDEPPAGGPGAD